MVLKPHSTHLFSENVTIKRALLSVSDKTGVVELAKTLIAHDVELLSTGGTAKAIRDAGFPVTDVSEITGFPECLGGRVKTLHPNVHGGILGRFSFDKDRQELENLGIAPIELVVVNLYPFRDAISNNITKAEALENIDIGGPTMVRAAAKNFPHVAILSNPNQYESITTELKKLKGALSFNTRSKLATAAFEHTAHYDSAIANYLSGGNIHIPNNHFSVSLHKSQTLRYGENPHQQAAVFGNQNSFIDCFHGKQLSFNNFLDVDGALHLIQDFKEADPTIAIFKHTVPCGVATAESLSTAYQLAFETDQVSPFGGIVVSNNEIDLETAESIDKIFTEIIIAPDFSKDALNLLSQKKNRRLIRILKYPNEVEGYQYRSVFGGALLQQEDIIPFSLDECEIVSKRTPSNEELKNLDFAWRVVKHIKSNAIVFAKNRQTLGIGGGQTSRIDSSEIAVLRAEKYGLSLKDSAIASDAFFPFADGVEAAAKAGATCIIQPGGSIRDSEVIAMADKYNMAMLFTRKRHFRH